MGYGANGMNSTAHEPSQRTVYTGESPLISVSPITLSGEQLRWIAISIFGAIWSAYLGGWLFLPAKDSEVKALTVVVQQLATSHADAKREHEASARRLTEAVDNLSGVVEMLRSAPPRTIERLLPRPSPRAAPARRAP